MKLKLLYAEDKERAQETRNQIIFNMHLVASPLHPLHQNSGHCLCLYWLQEQAFWCVPDDKAKPHAHQAVFNYVYMALELSTW